MDKQGDACFIAFVRARDALVAAVAAQVALFHHSWPDGVALRARMGLHTCELLRTDTGYVGMDVHRAARIGATRDGGQILLSDTTHGLVARDLPLGISQHGSGVLSFQVEGCSIKQLLITD